MTSSDKLILAIDPGSSKTTQGSATVLNLVTSMPIPLLVPLWVFAFFQDSGWEEKLYRAAIVYAPDVVTFEKVHSMPGQGRRSIFTFGEASGAAKSVLLAAGYRDRITYRDPRWWQRRIGLPKHYEIRGKAPRRKALRADQEAWALEFFPGLTKVEGDVFASGLIGVAEALDVLKLPLGTEPRKALKMGIG